MRTTPIDVFLTHDKGDAELARRARAAVVAADLTCWCEAVDLLPGAIWDEVVPERLMAAQVMAVLITPRWGERRGKDWYGPEKVALAVHLAQQTAGHPIIVPVLMPGAAVSHIPFGLLRTTRIELADGDVARMAAELARTVAAARGEAVPDAPPPGPAARGWLDRGSIERVIDAFVERRLDRDLLLSWIDPRVVATLHAKATPLDQVTADLMALNSPELVASQGQVPLESWLAQAIRLAGPFSQARVYRDVLAELRARVAERG